MKSRWRQLAALFSAVSLAVWLVPLSLAAAASLSLTGGWSGYIVQQSMSPQQVAMTAQIQQNGASLTGTTSDPYGPATISGSISGSSVEFIKQYTAGGSPIRFLGTLSANGTQMSGQWTILGAGGTGTWTLTLQGASPVPPQTQVCPSGSAGTPPTCTASNPPASQTCPNGFAATSGGCALAWQPPVVAPPQTPQAYEADYQSISQACDQEYQDVSASAAAFPQTEGMMMQSVSQTCTKALEDLQMPLPAAPVAPSTATGSLCQSLRSAISGAGGASASTLAASVTALIGQACGQYASGTAPTSGGSTPPANSSATLLAAYPPGTVLWATAPNGQKGGFMVSASGNLDGFATWNAYVRCGGEGAPSAQVPWSVIQSFPQGRAIGDASTCPASAAVDQTAVSQVSQELLSTYPAGTTLYYTDKYMNLIVTATGKLDGFADGAAMQQCGVTYAGEQHVTGAWFNQQYLATLYNRTITDGGSCPNVHPLQVAPPPPAPVLPAPVASAGSSSGSSSSPSWRKYVCGSSKVTSNAFKLGKDVLGKGYGWMGSLGGLLGGILNTVGGC